MGVGMSGLVSNMDTDSIVKAMVSTYTSRKETYTKAQTKLEWTQDAWKSLNTKIYGLYSKTLSDLRFSDAYSLKKTTVSDPSVATVSANTSSVNGSQTLAVRQLAKSGYLTGAKISTTANKDVTTSTKLSELGISGETKLNVNIGSKSTNVTVTEDTTVGQFVSSLKNAGLNASFDEKNQRFFVSSSESGKNNDFSLASVSSNGVSTLKKLGLYSGASTADLANYQKWAAYTSDDVASMITASAEAKYTNAAAETKLLQDTNKKLTEENTALTAELKALNDEKKLNDYASDYTQNFYLIENWSSSENQAAREAEYSSVSSIVSDFQDRVTAGETLSEEDQTAFNNAKLKKLAIEQTDAAIGADTFTTEDRVAYRDRAVEAATKDAEDITTKTNTRNTNTATITENEAILAGTAAKTVEQIVSEKNAATLAAVTTEINNTWEFAKSYMVQFNHNADPTSVTTEEYNASVASIGDIRAAANTDGSGATRINGQDAIIDLNGAVFESNSNTFSINGLSITATNTTGKNDDDTYKTVSLTTSTDVDGIYNSIKKFFTEYNSLIKEMDTQFNAASAAKYNVLSADEKEAMTDDEIEKWEKKIKDSLLRRDSTLDSLTQTMKTSMSKGVEVNDKSMYLSSFGINTLGYFVSGDNEKGVFHIDGDSDDSSTSGNKDKLKTAIASDPESVMKFFSGLTTGLYDSLYEKMQSTTLSSAYTVYNDKQMTDDYKGYTEKIADVETEIKYWEDFYYSKFTAMEKALSSLNAKTSQLSSMLGN